MKLYKVEVDGWDEQYRGFIGDQTAYQRVRAKYQTIDDIPGLTGVMKESVEIVNAFGVGLVDELPVRVCRAWPSMQMEYLQHGSATSSKGRVLVTTLSSVNPYGVAKYSQPVGCGFVFIPGDRTYSHKIEAATVNEFIQTCREKFKIELTGVT